MTKKILIAVCTGILGLAVACGKSAVPTSPNSASNADAAAAADGSTLKIGAPTLTAPANGLQNPAGSTDPITLSLTNVSGTYASFTSIYEFEIRNPAGTIVWNPKVTAAASGSTSTAIALSVLTADTSYSWRARATFGTGLGPWSATRTFRTPIAEGFFGQTVVDPLTNGKTYGKQRGGRFVDGGWQALTLADGIDYDIPTLAEGTIEFDITNIGQQEGQAYNADLKFLTMGDANAFGSFGVFRDHQWKMHLVQRADNDGLEIIWRNGGTDADGGNPGDHRIKMPCCGPPFRGSYVTHFRLRWDDTGYLIEAGTNGGPLEEYLSDGFGGIPYAPPNHRISLGCYPRNETIPFAIYRNVKIRPGSN